MTDVVETTKRAYVRHPVKAHTKIISVLRKAALKNPETFVSPAMIKNRVFRGDFAHVVERFATFMYDVKKHGGGVIETAKNGVRVVGYRLVNFADYLDDGTLAPVVSTPKKTRTKKVANTDVAMAA